MEYIPTLSSEHLCVSVQPHRASSLAVDSQSCFNVFLFFLTHTSARHSHFHLSFFDLLLFICYGPCTKKHESQAKRRDAFYQICLATCRMQFEILAVVFFVSLCQRHVYMHYYIQPNSTDTHLKYQQNIKKTH